jgi:hypothetical protein
MKNGTSYSNASSRTRNGLLGKGFHNQKHLNTDLPFDNIKKIY